MCAIVVECEKEPVVSFRAVCFFVRSWCRRKKKRRLYRAQKNPFWGKEDFFNFWKKRFFSRVGGAFFFFPKLSQSVTPPLFYPPPPTCFMGETDGDGEKKKNRLPFLGFFFPTNPSPPQPLPPLKKGGPFTHFTPFFGGKVFFATFLM